MMPFLCVTHNDPANFVLSLPYRFTFPGHPQAELLLQYNSTRNLCNLRSGQVANDKKEDDHYIRKDRPYYQSVFILRSLGEIEKRSF